MEKEFFRNKNFYQDTFKIFESVYNFRKRSIEPTVEAGGGGGGGIKKNEMEGSRLEDKLRGFLILGRLLGLIPTSGIIFSTQKGLRFKMLSLPAIFNMIVGGLVGITATTSAYDAFFARKSNVLEIAGSVQGTVFRTWVLFNYVYFLLKADSFLNIFKTWRKLSSSLNYPVEDKTLKRDIIIICTIIFSFAIFETVILHMEYFPQFDHLNGRRQHQMAKELSKKSSFEYYYGRSHPEIMKHVRYNPILTGIIFIVHKYVMTCWNYVDVVLIVFSRALYAKFKGLWEVAEEKLKDYGKGGMEVQQRRIYVVDATSNEQSCWRNIVKDHDTLCLLLEAFEEFFSPVIFGSYAINVYYICMQLIEGLSPDRLNDSLLRSIYAPVSFLTIALRVFLVSNMGARISTYAHALGDVLKKVPIELYDAEVARVDHHVTSGPDIGLTGIGMFTVTKPFILSIISTVFTVEIVLLQGITTTMPSGTCSDTKPS